MHAKLTMPLAFLAVWGCAHGQVPAEPKAPGAEMVSPASEPAPADTPAEPPAATLSEANRLYDSQLGATRGGQFEVDRQVAELQRAILLYKQFIERADGQPEMAAAVKKSLERIADACQTIGFLLATPDGQARTPIC